TNSTEADAMGNVNKHRYQYSAGVKATEEQKWGRDKAVERYGRFPTPSMKAEDRSEPQKLGDKNNLRGPDWQDDTANDWRRGFGKNGVESAEGKPGYVPGYRGKK